MPQLPPPDEKPSAKAKPVQTSDTSIGLDNEQNVEIFKRILKRFFTGRQPDPHPQAFILGGQPGAGKSLLREVVEKDLPGIRVAGGQVAGRQGQPSNPIYLSADDLRVFHPAYEKLKADPATVDRAANLVAPYANQWTEALIRYAAKNKFSLIIDSTLGGKVEANRQTIGLLKDNGYQVHLRVMAVPGNVSKLGIYERYEHQLGKTGSARWTRMEDHNERYIRLPVVLAELLANSKPANSKTTEGKTAGEEGSKGIGIVKGQIDSVKVYKRDVKYENGQVVNRQVSAIYENAFDGKVWAKPMKKNTGGAPQNTAVAALEKERQRPPTLLEMVYLSDKSMKVMESRVARGAEIKTFLEDVHLKAIPKNARAMLAHYAVPISGVPTPKVTADEPVAGQPVEPVKTGLGKTDLEKQEKPAFKKSRGL